MKHWNQIDPETKVALKWLACFVVWGAAGYWIFSLLPACNGNPAECATYVVFFYPTLANTVTFLTIMWLAVGLTMLRMNSKK